MVSILTENLGKIERLISGLSFTSVTCRVRLVKVLRNRDGTQSIIQYNVQLLLEGDTMGSAFLTGDNSQVVPTDTCKNTVYCVASQNEFSSMEEFGILICKHFLKEYPKFVNKITVTIFRDLWERVQVPDSYGRVREHSHAFRRMGPLKPFTVCVGEKRYNSALKLGVTSGFKSLEILKTTQSGFVGYPKDRYTSLPEATDRILGTSADVEWTYSSTAVNRGGIDYNQTFDRVMKALVETFAGPADSGVYSKSVQETLYLMGSAALKAVDGVEEVSSE